MVDSKAGIFIPAHSRGAAMLSQDPLLFPHMSVAANVAFAARCKGYSRPESRAITQRWLAAVDAAGLAHRRPAQLSGGQAQRIALARALAAEPRVLLLDEPMAALDVASAPMLRRLLRRILHDDKRTALIVTHDLLDALAIADSVIVLEGGRVAERGAVRSVLTSPRSAYAARIAGVDLMAGTITRPGVLRTGWGTTVFGMGDVAQDAAAVALFRPATVAIHLEAPQASPRNVLPVTIAAMDVHGSTVRVRGEDLPDGSAGLAADVTAAAAADLNLSPGQQVYFVVKAQEVELHPALASPTAAA